MIDGLSSLPGKVALSAGVKICHVNVSRRVTRLAGVAFMAKSSKANHVCYVCFFSLPSHGRNHQKPQRTHKECKYSHFGKFSVVNRPYFVSQTIPFKVLSQRFLA